jgi:KaiC/GvpD/RAD55 family RecA-like ATPase
MKNILPIFKKNNNVVFLCRNTDPINFTIDFLKSLSPKTRVLYVTVNKSYSALSDKFNKEGINFSNWSFIDCISSSLFMAEKSSKQCLYLTSPQALVDLALAIDEKMKSVDVIVFDNISGLLVYNGSVPTMQLLNSLMSKVRQTKIKAAYLLFHDTNAEVMEDLALFSDKVEII